MRNSKRGSLNIFLSIVITALASIVLLLVYSAREQAIYSCSDGVFNLAGDSVLSEYDYYVYKDYGLFVINKADKELTKEFKSYADYTFKHISKASLKNVSVSAGRFSTINITPIKEQILHSTLPNKIVYQTASSTEDNNLEDRTLRHGPTIVSLPSRSLPDKSILTTARKLADNLTKPSLIFKEGTNKYLLDSYILTVFNNENAPATDNHFFRDEVEYIICGELSDEKNRKRTNLAIEAVRTGLNLQHIYSDPEKLAAVEAASQVITPGIFGTVTQLGIATAWAGAEATNDLKLLQNGYKVPIIKDASSWAIDLDSLINGYDADEGFIKPAVNKGRDYTDYLRVLLFIKDDNVKVARVLDLIQINMRQNYDADFLIQECATGISIDATVNKKRFSYDKIY